MEAKTKKGVFTVKYRDLRLSFPIEEVPFTVISICLEKLPLFMPMHSHSKNSYEIHYVSYGYGTLRTDRGSFPITPGSFFVTGPGVEHEQVSAPETPMTEYCIYLKITPPERKKQRNDRLIKAFTSHPFWFGTGDTSVYDLMNQIIRELETRKGGYELVLQSLLQQLIILLVRKYEESDTPEEKVSSVKSNTGDLTYLIIEEAFLYNYSDITLSSLSEKLGLGTRQTERLLQMHYHKTFQEKKTEARMSAACSLLRFTPSPISSVAEQLGYASAEHFSTAFRKYHSLSPSEFRKMSKESAF